MVSQFIILGIYILLLVFIAIFSIRKTKTTDDFFLGGRKIGAWMTAFAYGTTYFSAVMFVGYAGKYGWNFGVSATWIGIANAVIGTLIAWLLLAKPTRRITHRLDASTMPDFFLKRYKSQGLKITAAIIIFVFLVPYCASVYQGLGYFFEIVFNIPYEYCMIGMAVFTALYLLAGGYVATALTDFIQGLIMIIGAVLMIAFVVANPLVGGLAEGLSKIAAVPEIKTAMTSPDNVVLFVSLILLTSLGTWGLPQMVHKFYAIKDKKAINKGTVISTLFALIVGGIAYFSGTFGRLFLTEAPENMDMVMPQVMSVALPPVLLGIILVLILAASMSTLSSLVLVSSSSISMDLVKGVIKPQMKDKSVMKLMRTLCAVFVVISLVIALAQPTAIVTLMSYSWGALSGCFLAPFLLGVRWKGMTKAGAWAGIITGLAITVPLMILNAVGDILPSWMNPPAIGSMSMIISLFVTPAVSTLTRKFEAEHVSLVFGEGKEIEA
ncbi:MAG: sodium:solute symporter family transporter [Christensenellales bacterium]